MVEQPMPREQRDDMGVGDAAKPPSRLRRRGHTASGRRGRNEGYIYRHQHQADEVHGHARGVEDAHAGTCPRHEGHGRVHDRDLVCLLGGGTALPPPSTSPIWTATCSSPTTVFRGMEVIDGKITIPDRPGIGVETHFGTTLTTHTMRHTLNPRYLVAAAANIPLCGPAAQQHPHSPTWRPKHPHTVGRMTCGSVWLSISAPRRSRSPNTYAATYPTLRPAQMRAWEASGALECMVIDGTRHYFHAAARNLFRIDPQCRAIKQAADGVEHSSSERANLKKHSGDYIRGHSRRTHSRTEAHARDLYAHSRGRMPCLRARPYAAGCHIRGAT